MSEADLNRVKMTIGEVVHAFAKARMAFGQRRFHMSDLNLYVEATDDELAPDSAGRILRQLRQSGKVKYKVVDRSKSLYELESA